MHLICPSDSYIIRNDNHTSGKQYAENQDCELTLRERGRERNEDV
jgi:hypothetical protein